MPDYSKGKIYKLWCPDNDLIYIGSTTQSLHQRLGGHKKNIKQTNACKSKLLFEASNEVKVELIEEYPCNNKMELNKREGEIIRLNKCVNKRVEGRTKKEYQQDNKKEIKEYLKKNKEKIKEDKKEWYQINKEEIKENKKQYYQKNQEKLKLKYKIYHEKNKEDIKLREKKYRDANRDWINQKAREKYKLNKLITLEN